MLKCGTCHPLNCLVHHQLYTTHAVYCQYYVLRMILLQHFVSVSQLYSSIVDLSLIATPLFLTFCRPCVEQLSLINALVGISMRFIQLMDSCHFHGTKQ